MPHVLVAGKLHRSGVDLLRGTQGLTFDLIDEISERSYAPLFAELTTEGAERLTVYSVQNVIDFFASHLDPSLIVNATAIGRQKASMQ